MTAYEIPLSPQPQTLNISLAGTDYTLTLKWNAFCSYWTMDIALADTGVYLLRGIPLVTGADLLAQYEYLGIGGQLVVQSDSDPLLMPTFDNLGVTSHLYFIPYPTGGS